MKPLLHIVSPFESSWMGCLSAVMSLKVRRKSTTTSRSFFTGDTCRNSHSGVPAKVAHYIIIIYIMGTLYTHKLF